MKTYTTKSNAFRAAKSAGFEKDQVNLVEVDGQFGFEPKPIPTEIVCHPVDSSGVSDYVVHGFVNCPHCGCHLSNGIIGRHADEVNGKWTIFTKECEYWCLACEGEFGPKLQPGKVKIPSKKIPKINESTISNPCKEVWNIATEMHEADPTAKRGAVLAACVAKGIAYYTARTQYQQWLGVQKEMAAATRATLK